jgi:pimeloyl-ACP methyl ester carboxylesterase
MSKPRLDPPSAFQDALNITKVYALGTSQGGFIVSRMAILRPDKMLGIVPIGSSMYAETEKTRQLGCWNTLEVFPPVSLDGHSIQSNLSQYPALHLVVWVVRFIRTNPRIRGSIPFLGRLDRRWLWRRCDQGAVCVLDPVDSRHVQGRCREEEDSDV